MNILNNSRGNRSIPILPVLVLVIASSIHVSFATKIPTFDLQRFINSEIESGKKVITVPKGRFRVNPEHRVHLLLENLQDVTIDATGVEMICTQTTRAISINNCQNLTIKGLTVDYDPLCFTQGIIKTMSPDKSYMEVQLFDGYPQKTSTKLEIFNPETKLLRRHTYYGWQSVKKTGDKTFRFTKAATYKYNPQSDLEEVGDIVVINSDFAPDGMIPHAIHSDYCRNLRLENITVYSGPTFAFFETNGTRNTYYRCSVDRRPENTDYEKRTMRYRSNNADAFHSKFAFVGPQIIECSAQFQGDDGVNICGIYYFVLSSEAGILRIVSHREPELQKGSILDCISYKGDRIQNLKVLDVRDGGTIKGSEIEFVNKCTIHEKIKSDLINPTAKVYEVVVDKEHNLDMGSVISDANRTGNGFLVKNCNFSNNRSRGILIKASNGSIDSNTLNGNWLTSILISPEAFWLESGCSDNVKVVGNKINNNASGGAIIVNATCMSKKVPPMGIHNQIIIENNTILKSSAPVIRCFSTKALKVKNNLVDSVLVDINKDVKLVNCELAE